MSCTFAWYKMAEIHAMSLSCNKAIADLSFGRREVLLNSKLKSY